jgi:hypothetical protein
MNSKLTSKFHTSSMPQLSSTLKTKNYLIQREFDQLKTMLDRQVEIEKQKDVRFKLSLEKNLQKLQSFRQTQFESEYEQQVGKLKKAIEKENLEKSFRKINKNNRLLFNTLPNKYEVNVEEDKSFKIMKQKIRLDLLSKFNLNAKEPLAKAIGLRSRQTSTLQDFRKDGEKFMLTERSRTFHDFPPIKKVTFPFLDKLDGEMEDENKEKNDLVNIVINKRIFNSKRY